MTLYETIFVRRAVRKFDKDLLDRETLADIQRFLDQTDQMQGQKATFQMAPAEAVKGTQAPHAILAYCEPNSGAYANAGYVLQNCDLYIQSLGLGSIFLGMAKPVEKKDGFCILLAFGKSQVPFRTSEEDFKRLSIEDICEEDNPTTRAARLAPSAVNSQPWKIDFGRDLVRVRYCGRGIKQLALRKMNKIDVGIISRHIVLALQEEGKEVLSVTPKSEGKDLTVEVQYQ